MKQIIIAILALLGAWTTAPAQISKERAELMTSTMFAALDGIDIVAKISVAHTAKTDRLTVFYADQGMSDEDYGYCVMIAAYAYGKYLKDNPDKTLGELRIYNTDGLLQDPPVYYRMAQDKAREVCRLIQTGAEPSKVVEYTFKHVTVVGGKPTQAK